ncbi:Hypothetical protein I595_2959 [Croceitalea dokdonensis DOKDO 023]|uniref:Uncharacterized protein n=1 Tax=Croceitalea dokdonensis DOKDO 023 TaxID=1300341 RepID=A0A0N8H3M4_9FLAO|nr:hypothetical protein [Croceitalea dokdonensis]KPM30980.1 Hypothetical protein I595_2959 [Croceitalea dokdonensis DOKDO 023]
MKLSANQIKHIDTYLQNSGIEYIDVRMELVDHVALAVLDKMEQQRLSFYDAFKWYMVEHKKDMVKNYDRFRKKNQLRGFSLLFTMLKKPFFIGLFVLLFFVIFNCKRMLGVQFPHIPVLWGSLVGLALIYLVFSIPFKKNRFSGMESLAWIISLIHWMILLLFNFTDLTPGWVLGWPIMAALVSSSLLTVFMVWIVVFFQQKNVYKTKYAQLCQ